MKLEIARLGENCKRQEREIQSMLARMPNVQNLLRTLREKQAKSTELQKANLSLKEQLGHSITMNEVLIDRVATLYQEIENLTEENYRLAERSKLESTKSDDFGPLFESSKSSIAALPPKSQVKPSYDYNPMSDRPKPQSTSISSGYSDHQNFNAAINLPRLGKSRSILGEQLERKGVLEPSNYFASKESNLVFKETNYSNFTTRDSGFGLQRRERR